MKQVEDDMRTEYRRSDFQSLECGKFYKEVVKGSSVALLVPAVAKAIQTSEAVNAALLGLLALIEKTVRLTRTLNRRAPKRAAG